MQNFKPVELEDVYRLFNLGATSLVSAADGNDVDVMPATWVCPLNTTPALSTAVIDSVFNVIPNEYNDKKHYLFIG